jgi:polyphosphate kinase
MSFDAFVNRELWWLEGNCSLLEDAQDSTAPALARLRSLGVVSANLDEFFMARVPALKRLARDRAAASSERPAAQRMKTVAQRVHRLVEVQQRCFFGDLRDRLAQDGILLLQPEALTRKQRYLLEEHFLATIFPVLTPLAVGPGHRFPFLGNRSLSLLVSTRPSVPSALPHSELSLVHIPSQKLPRFVAVPDPRGRHAFMLLEDVVRLHLPAVCHGYEIVSSHAIRITREANPPKTARSRHRGIAVRLQLDDTVPSEILALVRDELGLSDDDVYAGPGVVALSGLLDLHAAVAEPTPRKPRKDPSPSVVTLERVFPTEMPALAPHS